MVQLRTAFWQPGGRRSGESSRECRSHSWHTNSGSCSWTDQETAMDSRRTSSAGTAVDWASHQSPRPRPEPMPLTPALRGVASGLLNSAAQVGVALLVPLGTTAGWAVMTGYRIGFLGACTIALVGALSSFLMPARPHQSNPAMALTADYLPQVGGSKRRRQRTSLKGNDHHDHARTSRGARR